MGKGSWAQHRAVPSTWHLPGWAVGLAGDTKPPPGHRQELSQPAMLPATQAGSSSGGRGPTAGRPRLRRGARRGWERVHPREECGLGGAAAPAPALTPQPPLRQQPPHSMAEKPQIQLFVKVRGGSWGPGVPRPVGTSGCHPGIAGLGWPSCPCPAQCPDEGPWAGSGRLGALLQGTACCCLPRGHGGAVGAQPGVPPLNQGPLPSSPATGSICLPASAGPFPGTARPGQFVRLCRAGEGPPGILPGGDRATSIATTFHWHNPCWDMLGCPLPQPPQWCHHCPQAPSSSALQGWGSLGPPGHPGVPWPAPAVPRRLLGWGAEAPGAGGGRGLAPCPV